MSKLLAAVCYALILLSQTVAASEEMLHFDTDVQRALFRELIHEYRCLKCQNQTIASSNADLAGDLRDEIHAMVLANKTRAEIDTYLLARYGDFVLYKPRFKTSTLLLWLGPFLFLILALWIAYKTARSRSQAQATVDQTQLAKARALLKKST